MGIHQSCTRTGTGTDRCPTWPRDQPFTRAGETWTVCLAQGRVGIGASLWKREVDVTRTERAPWKAGFAHPEGVPHGAVGSRTRQAVGSLVGSWARRCAAAGALAHRQRGASRGTDPAGVGGPQGVQPSPSSSPAPRTRPWSAQRVKHSVCGDRDGGAAEEQPPVQHGAPLLVEGQEPLGD